MKQALITTIFSLLGLFIWAQPTCQDPEIEAEDPINGQLWAGSEETFYSVGENISFIIQSNTSGDVSYTIKEDIYLSAIDEGTINVTANTPYYINTQLNHEGFLLLQINQNGQQANASVAIEACQITPLDVSPTNLNEFWDSLKNELSQVPMNALITERPDKSNAAQNTYKMILDNIDGKKVYGWISVPNCDGPFSAILELPPFGTQIINPVDYYAQDGAIGVAISVHDYDCEQEVPGNIAYSPNNHFYDKNTNYYKAAILGAIRALDYISSRSDFDGVHLAVSGVSQGGGLSIITAGLDNRVKYLAQSVAAFCNHPGYLSNRSSGFPYWLKETEVMGGNLNEVKQEIAYYDAVYFAQKFKGPSFNAVGYNDMVCPPSTVFTAYNQLLGPKTMLHGITTGHANHPNFWSMRNSFFAEHLPLKPYWGGCPPYTLDSIAPSAIIDLEVISSSTTSVEIGWTATGDDLQTGTAYSYDFRYSEDPITENNFTDAHTSVNYIYPDTSGTNQTLSVPGLEPATLYYFGIRVMDEVGNTSLLSNIASGYTDFITSSAFTTTQTPHIHIWPNPVSNNLFIASNNPDTFQIIDAVGNTILEFYLSSHKTLNISVLKPGIYFIQNNQGNYKTKFVKL